MVKTLVFSMLIFSGLSSHCQGSSSKASKNSVVRLTKEIEPGKPFTLDITVLDIESRKPAKDTEVFAYHTNHIGDYEHDSKGVVRIHGTAFSDEKGAIRFYTIYPRGYHNSSTGEHIHFVVKGNGYKKENKELDFSDYYQRRYDPKNPVAHTVYLERPEEKNGRLFGVTTIFMKKG